MTVSTDRLTHCYFNPATCTCIDVVNPDTGRAFYSGDDLAGVQARYPGAVLITLDEAADRTEARARTEPVEITRERFLDMLDMLPPQRWTNLGVCESFAFMEHTSGRVTMQFVRIGVGTAARFFEFQDVCTLTHGQRLDRVREVFPNV